MGRRPKCSVQVDHLWLQPESGTPAAVIFNAIWYGAGQHRRSSGTGMADDLIRIMTVKWNGQHHLQCAEHCR